MRMMRIWSVSVQRAVLVAPTLLKDPAAADYSKSRVELSRVLSVHRGADV